MDNIKWILFQSECQVAPTMLWDIDYSERQGDLVCYSPRGCKESDMTEQPNNNNYVMTMSSAAERYTWRVGTQLWLLGVQTDDVFWPHTQSCQLCFCWQWLMGRIRHGDCALLICVCSVAQSCLTLWDPMDCSPPSSSLHGSSQARIPKWVAISYSRGSSWPRNRTQVSCISRIGRWILYHCATWKIPTFQYLFPIYKIKTCSA